MRATFLKKKRRMNCTYLAYESLRSWWLESHNPPLSFGRLPPHPLFTTVFIYAAHTQAHIKDNSSKPSEYTIVLRKLMLHSHEIDMRHLCKRLDASAHNLNSKFVFLSNFLVIPNIHTRHNCIFIQRENIRLGPRADHSVLIFSTQNSNFRTNVTP